MSIDLSKMPKIGFGLMRLPETDGAIDIAKVCEMATLKKLSRKQSLKGIPEILSRSQRNCPHGA